VFLLFFWFFWGEREKERALLGREREREEQKRESAKKGILNQQHNFSSLFFSILSSFRFVWFLQLLSIECAEERKKQCRGGGGGGDGGRA